MSRDPEKHRKSSLKYYYLHRDKIRERRRKRYAEDHKQARAVMDPLLAARMAAMRSVPRRSLQHSWARNLLEEMDASLGAEGMSHHSRKTLRWAFRLILAHAEKNGLAHTRDLIPAWLTGFPPQTKDPRKEPIYRANFGRMLLRLGLWSNEDYDLFEQNLEHSFKRSRTGDRPLPRPKGAPGRKVYFSPEELCHLAFVLAYRCGLSVGEIQGLRVEGIGPDGVRTSPNLGSHRPVSTISRLIRFGGGWEKLPSSILSAYLTKEKPTDYLFFSRSPRDKKRPLSTMTLNGAIAKLRPSDTVTSLREQHFRHDFERARSLQEARFYLRNVHHLDNQYIHNRIAGSERHAGYATQAETIPVPLPYLIATMCVSRSASEKKSQESIPEGGKRYIITWHDPLGYEIRVDWTRAFASDLGIRGQKSDRTLRLLYRLAFDFWFEGRRMKLPDIQDSAIRAEDKDLLGQLAAVTVLVRDVKNPLAFWAGSPFEYRNRRSAFRIPLIEEMNRCAWHNQCLVCWHPNRDSIEREVLEAATRQTTKKGYNLIANKYGVSDQSLAGHRGKKSPPRGRGEKQRSHFSSGLIAPIVRCPRLLFDRLQNLSERELMIYTMLLLESSGPDANELICSTSWIEERLGFNLSESQLSIVLNHLAAAGTTLLDYRKGPQGFYVQLLIRPLTRLNRLSA